MTTQIKITKIGKFNGTKITLNNTTVRKYIDTKGVLQYLIFKGKGTGSQIAMTSDFSEVESFDMNFNNLVYKTIYSNEDGTMGGAYFLNDKILFKSHPFLSKGFHF